LLQVLVPAENSIPEWICIAQDRVHPIPVVFFVFDTSEMNKKVSKVLVPSDLAAFTSVKGIKKAERRHLRRRFSKVRTEEVATMICSFRHLVASCKINMRCVLAE
jgi:hypothetical protein